MSRRARTRRDKRTEAEEFLGLDDDSDPAEDAPFTLTTGERMDPRSPWAIPATTQETTTERTAQ